MHITNNHGVNVAALTCGIRVTDKLLKRWAEGAVELYSAISEWASIVTAEEVCLSNAINATGADWGGVFAYEVTEQVGADIRRMINEGDDVTPAWIQTRTIIHIQHLCLKTADYKTLHAYHTAREEVL